MRCASIVAIVVSACLITNVQAQDKSKAAADTSKPKKPASITDKIKTARAIPGMFTLYQDTVNGGLQLYVRKEQLSQPYIYQSFSINGPTTLFLNQSMHRANFVVRMDKAFDKIELSRVNTAFYYDPSNPVSKTKNVDKPEAVILSEKIVAEDSTGYLISADGMFLGDKLDPVKPASSPGFFMSSAFTLGNLNPAKSKYTNVRSFPENTDVIVDLAYDNSNSGMRSGDDITDNRYVRVRMQHSFLALPKNNYQPRLDDPRVGYFTSNVTDLTSIKPTPFRDQIHRWNLVKKDPTAALSEPVEPIVFWIENTTPYEYRPIIMEAGLKWNKAFEQAGFKDAVQMKIMPDNADWDPADVRYNVIRWVSSLSPSYGAIGPSFVNPITGQILGADITIEWASGSFAPIYDELFESGTRTSSAAAGNPSACTLGNELKSQYTAALTALEMTAGSPAEVSLLHKQFLTYLIMHEMGHTLGLNHNMKASNLWNARQINDTTLTHKFGLIGSVMDYPAVNISLDRKKQGDYYTTMAGPYDLWAIEYGYRPFEVRDEAAALRNILSRSNDPRLAFGNDGDDMRSAGQGMDPRVNINDLTSEPLVYAVDRFQIVNQLLDGLVKRYTKEGQSFAELRSRYNGLQMQRMDMITAVSRFIGGVYIDRSFPEQHSGNKPHTPVSLDMQKKAMSILSQYVFAPNTYERDQAIYPYLQPQRRGFNQSYSGDDYKATTVMSSALAGTAISQLLHPGTLQRITNSSLYGNQYSVAAMLSDLTAAIFNADLNGNVNVYRQNLQTRYVRTLAEVVEDKNNMYDDVASAGALYTLRALQTKLAGATPGNIETKAHREQLKWLIKAALETK